MTYITKDELNAGKVDLLNALWMAREQVVEADSRVRSAQDRMRDAEAMLRAMERENDNLTEQVALLKAEVRSLEALLEPTEVEEDHPNTVRILRPVWNLSDGQHSHDEFGGDFGGGSRPRAGEIRTVERWNEDEHGNLAVEPGFLVAKDAVERVY